MAASGRHPDHYDIRVPAFGDGAPLGNPASFTHAHRLAAVNNLGYSSNRHKLFISLNDYGAGLAAWISKSDDRFVRVRTILTVIGK